jgi:hypothetical protein
MDIPKRRSLSAVEWESMGCILTSRNDIVHHKHILSRAYGIGLNFEIVFAILFLERGNFHRTRKLSLFANRNERCTQPEREGGTEQKAAGFETHNDTRLVVLPISLQNMQVQAANERVMKHRILKDGQDVLEQDTRLGKVRELSQSSAEGYFKTGEFGGAGGRGGDGDLGGGAIVANRILLLTAVLGVLNAHQERRASSRQANGSAQLWGNERNREDGERRGYCGGARKGSYLAC